MHDRLVSRRIDALHQCFLVSNKIMNSHPIRAFTRLSSEIQSDSKCFALDPRT